jgi:hypothetical protein
MYITGNYPDVMANVNINRFKKIRVISPKFINNIIIAELMLGSYRQINGMILDLSMQNIICHIEDNGDNFKIIPIGVTDAELGVIDSSNLIALGNSYYESPLAVMRTNAHLPLESLKLTRPDIDIYSLIRMSNGDSRRFSRLPFKLHPKLKEDARYVKEFIEQADKDLVELEMALRFFSSRYVGEYVRNLPEGLVHYLENNASIKELWNGVVKNAAYQSDQKLEQLKEAKDYEPLIPVHKKSSENYERLAVKHNETINKFLLRKTLLGV